MLLNFTNEMIHKKLFVHSTKSKLYLKSKTQEIEVFYALQSIPGY